MKARKTGRLAPGFAGSTIAEYTDGTWRYTGDGGRVPGSFAKSPPWLEPWTPETSAAAHKRKAGLAVLRAAGIRRVDK